MSVYTIWTMYKTQRQDKKRVKPASAAYCFNLGRMAHAIELTRYPIGWEVPSVFPVSINNKFNHQKMLPKIASSSKRIHLVQMADYHWTNESPHATCYTSRPMACIFFFLHRSDNGKGQQNQIKTKSPLRCWSRNRVKLVVKIWRITVLKHPS